MKIGLTLIMLLGALSSARAAIESTSDGSVIGGTGFDQEASLESEVQGLEENVPHQDPLPAAKQEPLTSKKKKQSSSFIMSEDETIGVDLGPEQDAAERGLYKNPAGPVQGGVLRVPHPGAAKGLIKINKDGSYQYRTALRPKSQALGVRLGLMTAPDIKGPKDTISYKSMYGETNVIVLHIDYEWEPIQKFGAFGLQLGTGLGVSHGSGTLESSGSASEESYNLFVVPLSAFAIYRFEYVRRQMMVPFVNGGLTYYGLAEKRDDDKPIHFAGALAAGGGGGVHFSISRLDPKAAFTLDREYGVADMWFTLEARAMQGLDKSKDFSNQTVSGGITVDF